MAVPIGSIPMRRLWSGFAWAVLSEILIKSYRTTMATIYSIASDDIREQCDYVMEKYHSQLLDAGVTVEILTAYCGDEEEGPQPLKHHGYPCAALVRIVNLKDRVKGNKDAEIVIDGNKADEWSESELRAILDHELTHLELAYDKDGNLKRDDADRPKLKMRLHDRQFGWFDVIANRWGDDAGEVQQAKAMMMDWQFVQMYLPGFDASMLGADRPLLKAEFSNPRDRNLADEVADEFQKAGLMV